MVIDATNSYIMSFCKKNIYMGLCSLLWPRLISADGSDRLSLVSTSGVLEMRRFLTGRSVSLVCAALISPCISVRGVSNSFSISI